MLKRILQTTGKSKGRIKSPGESQTAEQKKSRIGPLMEAWGIEIFKTARANGFEIDTKRETYEGGTTLRLSSLSKIFYLILRLLED